MRKNFHNVEHRMIAAQTYIKGLRAESREVYWDKQAHGIYVVHGADFDRSYRLSINDGVVSRYVPLKTDSDVCEMFANYEDDE